MQAQPPSVDRFNPDTWDWKSVDEDVSTGYESDTEEIGISDLGIKPMDLDFSEGLTLLDKDVKEQEGKDRLLEAEKEKEKEIRFKEAQEYMFHLPY